MRSSSLAPSTLTHLECSSTGKTYDADHLYTVAPDSGRPLLARYDLAKAAQTLSLESLRDRPRSMWRFAEVLPVQDPRFRVTLGEGATPLQHCPRLGEELGLSRLFIKDESCNPTGTFKARGMSAAVSRALELGAEHVTVPTTGNAGAAIAAYAARAGLKAHVVMPRDASEAVQGQVRACGAELILVDGLISDAGKVVAEACATQGWVSIGTLKEPYRVEGKKTMGYELWEDFDGKLPDVILYPTGGGTGFIGIWKAFDELQAMGLIDDHRPRMIVVQAEGCAPVVKAFHDGAEKTEFWQGASTLAGGIRVPDTFADDLILKVARESHGGAVAVQDEHIWRSMHHIAATEGIDPCPEGAATFAALELMLESGDISKDETVVLFNCGTGLKHPDLRPTG